LPGRSMPGRRRHRPHRRPPGKQAGKQTMKDRALALAGVLQAVQLVQQMAQTGQAPSSTLAASIDSLFRFDAESPEAVFDGAGSLRPGLERLVAQLEGGAGRDAAITRMAMTVLHLERKFIQHSRAPGAVHEALQDIN